MSANPFFEDWTGPFGLPPFARLRPEHFPEAFARGIAEHEAEIAAIAGAAEPPTFANTVAALERSGRLLHRASRVFSTLEASDSSDALEAIARDWAPKLAAHQTRISLDPALFARIDALYRRRAEIGLAADELRLIERHRLRLVRAGALLGREKKVRIAAINERLAGLHTRFGQNVLHDEGAWRLVLGAADLDGLPDFACAAAAKAAQERGLAGQWVVTLARSSAEAFLTFSSRRDLRQALWQAWTGRGARPGAHDNRPVVAEIMALRQEEARLLGYSDFAQYRLDDTMAKDAAAVEELLAAVWGPAKKKAAAEQSLLARAARAGGQNEPLAPWDWRYWAERVRQAELALDEAEVKPYFVLDNIVEAAFATARRLFGLEFRARPDLAAYHPDVRVWEVRDGNRDAIGLFLHDNFARPGKRSGAWSSRLRDQENLDGPVLPIVVNNNNFARGEPTLLSFDDAETLFHEFGHGLHGLLSQVRFRSQSGTAVRRDFVEFPSQIFEHWMSVPENLRNYARHYRTGAPLPEDLLRRLLAARHFNQGFATLEYAASALFDLELHKAPAAQALDIDRFERDFVETYGVPAEIGLRHRPAHFQHLFAGSGYAAGYYAYLWAEVLDADGFAAFTEKGDVFDPELARRLEAIYRAGDTRDPMALYHEFRGREPRIEALLAQRGLAAD
jgi:peptidyl-dipeptidase Dcp